MPLSPSSMASIPQFYSNYTFTTSDLVDFPTPAALINGNNNNNNSNSNNYTSSVMDNFAMWGNNGQDGFSINYHPVLDNGALDHVVSLDCDTMSSASWMPSFGEQLGGVSDFAVPAISDCKMGLYGGSTITGFQSFSGSRFHQPRVGEFGEECCGFVEDIKPPAYPNAARENWGIQGNQMPAVEEPNIKYACRKTLADRRVRVRGRFARNNELCEEDMATKKHEDHHLKEDFYGGDSIQFQLKNDEEDWLQEAMASLVYLSHSSPEDM